MKWHNALCDVNNRWLWEANCDP